MHEKRGTKLNLRLPLEKEIHEKCHKFIEMEI